MAGEPESNTPEFFADRSLGRHRVPRRLREAGLDVRTLAEVYGVPADEQVADVEWLREVGRRGWVALMKDERIRYRHAERQALTDHAVRAFCLASGNLRSDEMADLYLKHVERIVTLCSQPGPFLYVVTRGGLRRVEM